MTTSPMEPATTRNVPGGGRLALAISSSSRGVGGRSGYADIVTCLRWATVLLGPWTDKKPGGLGQDRDAICRQGDMTNGGARKVGILPSQAWAYLDSRLVETASEMVDVIGAGPEQ